MDLEELQQIIRLLKEQGLTEITVSNGEKRITVRQEAAAGLLPRTAKLGAEEREEESNVITAPLLGTFYSRPSPEEDPFVNEGDQVSPGDTLCIIDAMKVMNEIKAEFPAKIVKVLVEDGDPLQYGQPMFQFERI